MNIVARHDPLLDSCCSPFRVLRSALAIAADVTMPRVSAPGRSAADVKRDALDHPAEILRLTGIKAGMHVADVLAGDGYYSELLGESGRTDRARADAQ